jgi:4-carboxymuconolactone decarboxylase
VKRFPPLEPEQLSPEQRRVVDALLAGPRGSMAGPFDALLRSPELADRLQRVGEQVRFAGSLPRVLNELAILLTARRWTAQFEWYAHRRMALEAGLDPAVADEIAAGRRPAGLDRDQETVHDFVSELLATGAVSDGAFAAAVERFGEQGAIDLIGTVGYYTIVSFVLNVDRYPLPEGEPTPLAPL